MCNSNKLLFNLIILSFIFLFQNATFIQNRPNQSNNTIQKDSILRLLKNENDSATLIKYYDELNRLCKEDSLEVSLKYAKEGMKYAEILNDQLMKMAFMIKIGDAYYELDSLEAAKDTYKALLDLSIKENYEEITINSLNDIGNVLFDLGDYDNSLAYYKKSLKIAKKNGLEDFETIPLGNISEIYLSLGDFDNAKKYVEMALVSSQKNNNKKDKSYHLTVDYWRLGDIFKKRITPNYPSSIKDSLLQKAIFYHKKALIESQKAGQLSLITNAYTTLSHTYSLDPKYNHQALIYSDSSLLNITKIKTYDIYSSAYLNAAQVNLNIGQVEKAFALGQKVESQKSTINNMKINQLRDVFFANYYASINNLAKQKEYKASLEKESLHFEQILSASRQKSRSSEDALTIKQQNKELTANNIKLIDANYYLKQAMIIIASLLFAFILFLLYHIYINQKRDKEAKASLKKEIHEKTKELNLYIKQLERFNYIVSHDLKEPIRNIISFCGLTIYKIKQGNKYEITEYLEFMLKSANQLNALVEGIIDFSKIKIVSDIGYEKVILEELVQEVKDALNVFIKEKNGEITFLQKVEVIDTYRLPLFIALKNLIENGLKYNTNEKPIIVINYQKMPEKHCLYVKDNGIGIDKEYSDMVFEMFKRLHNKDTYEGTGLGLAICKEVLQRVKGDIHIVDSTINEGTTFRVDLPIIGQNGMERCNDENKMLISTLPSHN